MPRFSTSQKKSMLAARKAGIAAFAVFMLLGAVVGLVLARPTMSTLENRNLTAFPEFTLGRFLDGSFTGDLSLWYADTYPLREPLVRTGQAMKNAYGIQTEERMIGGNVQADDIPDIESIDSSASSADGAGESSSGVSSSAHSERKAGSSARETAEMSADEVQQHVQQTLLGSLFVKGDTAYSFYYFTREGADAYADAINWVAQDLDGVAQVYSLLVPTSGGVKLSSDEQEAAGGSDQLEAGKYYRAKFDRKVKSIPAIEADCPDAILMHEAAIGKIAGDQIIKLMTLGLTEEEAEQEILDDFLS